MASCTLVAPSSTGFGHFTVTSSALALKLLETTAGEPPPPPPPIEQNLKRVRELAMISVTCGKNASGRLERQEASAAGRGVSTAAGGL